MAGFTSTLTHTLIDGTHANTLRASLSNRLEALRSQLPPQAIPQQDDSALALDIAKRWREKFRHLIVIGCGGSGLSGKALATLRYGMQSPGNGHSLHVLDNLGMHAFERLAQGIDLHEVCFLIVSK